MLRLAMEAAFATSTLKLTWFAWKVLFLLCKVIWFMVTLYHWFSDVLYVHDDFMTVSFCRFCVWLEFLQFNFKVHATVLIWWSFEWCDNHILLMRVLSLQLSIYISFKWSRECLKELIPDTMNPDSPELMVPPRASYCCCSITNVKIDGSK
jgi:hypothetical protein